MDRLRVLNGFDIDLAADQTRSANRGPDALTSISPALERAVGVRLGQTGVRDLLSTHPTPTFLDVERHLKATGWAGIARAVKARSPRLADKTADAVIAALEAQTVVVPAEATIGRVIAELAVELDRVFARRVAVATEIEEVSLAHPLGELLSSFPGIGAGTGSRILAEIGDGSRFADGDKLAPYAGLAPVTRQSGKFLSGETQSRRGNHRLKNTMFLAALASLRCPDSKAFYDRKRAEGRRHIAAVICLARRRCYVNLPMLNTHRPSSPNATADLADAAWPPSGPTRELSWNA